MSCDNMRSLAKPGTIVSNLDTHCSTAQNSLPETMPSSDDAAASGCPVMSKRGASSSAELESSQSGRFWRGWFSKSSDVHHSSSSAATGRVAVDSSSVSECPVKGNRAIPASIEEAANHSQVPVKGQRMALSTQRVISSIPRGDPSDAATTTNTATTTDDNNKPKVPAHQPNNSPLWMYPSEQQFYNAMLRKGYKPPIESIPSVLQIHNAVNERSWLQVCKWEKELHDNADPKLVKFVGRPKDLSPKAWWNSRVLMTQEPFDRHDWYVEDLEGGEPRRYVIDFYEGKEKSGGLRGKEKGGYDTKQHQPPLMKPPAMYIDVRPALDSPSAAVDRVTMFARETLPGIASVYDSYKLSSTTSGNNSTGSGGMKCAGDRTEKQ